MSLPRDVVLRHSAAEQAVGEPRAFGRDAENIGRLAGAAALDEAHQHVLRVADDVRDAVRLRHVDEGEVRVAFGDAQHDLVDGGQPLQRRTIWSRIVCSPSSFCSGLP